MENIKTLDELLAFLKTEDLDGVDMSSLPTFGGSEPSNTLGVWSWDEGRMIVGTCAHDFKIVGRY